ncbi:MAG: type II secretion system F family protein [Acidimicrobiia bacterium]
MTPTLLLLGVGWGVLSATPIALHARRRSVLGRFPVRRRRCRAAVPREWGPVGRVVGGARRRRATTREAVQLDRDLAAALDLLVVAVAAGAPPLAAVDVAARWAPPSVASHLGAVVRATTLGSSLTDALASMTAAAPALTPVADVLGASARLGAPAAGALERLAGEARAQSRRRAEARARVLPVKLLFPLVFLVLPAFGLLTVAPALISAMSHL